MNNPVIVKGNKQGIRLLISEDASIDDILYHLNHKLINTKNYYTNIKPIQITFEGQALTDDEKELIYDTLRNIGLNIAENEVAITDENYIEEKITKNTYDEAGLFFIGNIRKGQLIIARKSIVIIGDVLPGASVYSEGSVVVIGQAKGTIKAGFKGDKTALIYTV